MSRGTVTDPVWLNGRLLPDGSTGLSVSDRGFLLGIGVFETIAVVNGRAINWLRHIERMDRGMSMMGIPDSHVVRPEEILSELLHHHTDLHHGVFRITVTPGPGGRGLDPGNPGPPTVLATFSPLKVRPHHAIHLVQATGRKNPDQPSSRIKSTQYLDHWLYRREARETGADDALILTTEGQVCCATTANILIWDGYHLRTPGKGSGALPGTTLAWLNELLPSDRKIRDTNLSRMDLDVAKGVYLLNSLIGILPVNRIGDRRYYSDLNAVYGEMVNRLRQDVIRQAGPFVGSGIFPWQEEGPEA